MPPKSISRRRFISLIAIASALPTLAAAKAFGYTYSWHGTLMGTKAQLTFYGASQQPAIEITRTCLNEVRRLENIFSLYQARSELSKLNRSGVLTAPSQDMRQLLANCQHLHLVSKGNFDPSIQPLWALRTNWLSKHPQRADPPLALIAQTKALIGFDKIQLEETRIELGDAQALTLNGIAQGYITDRVTALLRRAGWSNILVNMGEYYAIGPKSKGSPFKLQLANSSQSLALENQALASSSGSGFVFPSSNGRPTHLINPKTGQSPRLWKTIHVRHPRAVIADGLSTSFCSMNAAQIASCLCHFPDASVWAQVNNGQIKRLHAAQNQPTNGSKHAAVRRAIANPNITPLLTASP